MRGPFAYGRRSHVALAHSRPASWQADVAATPYELVLAWWRGRMPVSAARRTWCGPAATGSGCARPSLPPPSLNH